MGNSLRKTKDNKSTGICMDGCRNFGTPSGQVVEREPISPDLFMRIGTRIATITAYYEHVVPSNSPVLNPPTNPPPVVRLPIQTPSMTENPIYDEPKGTK